MLLTALIMSLQLAHAVAPYYMIAELSGDMNSTESRIEKALQDAGFSVIGKYSPGKMDDHRVIVYTSKELQEYCNMVEDRGMLASALKVAIRNRKGVLQVSMINPEYLFYAYLRDAMDNNTIRTGLDAINRQAIDAMKTFGTPEPFGGDIDTKELMKYRYMMGMQQFDDPVVLKEFPSFENGVETIRNNLASKKGNTMKVYEIIDEDNNVAVFGVGLMDPDKGEGHFLEIIGKKHVAAMPYEIILEGNTATMLHGRFRFASHWPELTMGTFTKIMSTPGDVEDFMQALTE